MTRRPLLRLGRALNRHRAGLAWAGPLVLAAFYAVVVLLRAPLLVAGDRPVLNADSYNAIVAEMIEQGLIVPNPLAQQDVADPALPPVILSAEARGRADVRGFVAKSYLRTDLAANDGRWKVDGGRVTELIGSVHAVRQPVGNDTVWTGTLLYRPAAVTEKPRLGLTIEQTGQTIELGESAVDRDLNISPWIDVVTGESSGNLHRHFNFVDRRGGREVTVATFRLIGNTPILGVSCGNVQRVQVVLASFRHSPYPCAEKQSGTIYKLLALGDAVSFPSRPFPAERRFVISGDLAGLSAPRPFGERHNSTAVGGLGGQVAIAMDQVLTEPEWRGRIRPDTDILTTLDRPIQDLLDRAFPEATRKLATELGRRPDDPVIGAAVVMDTLNGDVLGLGSVTHPPREQDPFGTINQAFVAMAAGSTAKIPVSAAILSRFPALRSLCAHPSTVDADGKKTFDHVLGIQLEDKNLDTVSDPPWLDFVTFIRKSSNRYAAQLLLLASARTEGRSGFRPLGSNPPKRLLPQDQYGLGASCDRLDQTFTERPAVIFPWVVGPNGQPTDLMRLSGFDVFSGLGADNWIDRLELNFDMPMGQRGSAAPSHSTGIWDRNEHSYFAGGAFDAISPQREDFRFGAMQDLRGDYLQVILGGGNAGWTTVKLAEAYSRVVSGKQVQMRLRLPGDGDDVERDVGPLPQLSAESREVLLEGMRQVVSGGSAQRVLGGKLAALRPKIRDREEWRLYAKTGTPGSEVRERSRLNSTISRLADAGAIGFEQRRIAVTAHPGEREPQALRRTMDNLGYDTSPTALREVLGWIASENGRLGRLNSLVRSDAQGHLRIVADLAARRNRNLEIEENAVVAVVLARYCSPATGLLHPERVAPVRAVTLTVNLAARKRGGGTRSGENGALRFAGATLLDPAGPVIAYLQGGEQCRG